MAKKIKTSLSPRQYQAAHLIVQGRNYEDVSKQIGITPKTLIQWRKLPQFQEYLDVMVSDIRESLVNRLSNSGLIIIQYLTSLVQGAYDDEADVEDKIDACKVLLNALQKMQENTEIVRKLEALEQAIGNDEY